MRQKHVEDEYLKQEDHYDDNGELIDDYNEWLNSPDEELAVKVTQEIANLNLISTKLEFLNQIKNYSQCGIGINLKAEHLEQFLTYLLTQKN